MRQTFTALLCVLALAAFSGCSGEGAGGAGGTPGTPGTPGAAVEVATITLAAAAVPRSAGLSGRVVARATAEIRPQVDGIVESIAFQEGRPVEAGEVLFRLAGAKFDAARQAAAAALGRAEATLSGAQSTFDRTERLASTNAVSQQTLDEARTALAQAQADVEAAKADLRTAEINLDNTEIKAPIAGIIGTAAVSVGSLVTQNQTDALATIRQIDPVNVDLVDTSANLLRIRQEVTAGRLGRNGDGPPAVTLTLENGEAYPLPGTVSLVTVDVDEGTGTFTLRATFPNPDRVLLPGMFVRAAVDLGEMPGAFLVPQRAVQRGSSGEAIAYVAIDGKAEARTLETNGSVGNDWIVTGGVAEGERLIVDGFQKFSAGAAVTTVDASIDADGVVGVSADAAPSDSPTSGAGGAAR